MPLLTFLLKIFRALCVLKVHTYAYAYAFIERVHRYLRCKHLLEAILNYFQCCCYVSNMQERTNGLVITGNSMLYYEKQLNVLQIMNQKRRCQK